MVDEARNRHLYFYSQNQKTDTCLRNWTPGKVVEWTIAGVVLESKAEGFAKGEAGRFEASAVRWNQVFPVSQRVVGRELLFGASEIQSFLRFFRRVGC